jgi:cell division protein FtsB
MSEDYESYDDIHDEKVRSWLGKLAAEQKEHGDFRKEAEKALKIYEREDCDGKKTVFPMYTANVDILHAALFSSLPAPDIRRPHQDQGSKELAQAIQRAIEHHIDTEDYSLPAHRAVSEWLAGGLGVVWYRYAPEVVEMPIMEPVVQQVADPVTGEVIEQPVVDPETGEPVMEPVRDEDGQLVTEAEIESQTITMEYHPYHRFRWEPAVVWEDVDWISFDYIKTPGQIKAEYDVELDNLNRKNADRKAASASSKDGHIVHHIWCRKSRTVKVITPAHSEFLAEYDDPLGLEDFYPCPRPLMMNVQSGEITPRPDYVYIETQHDNIQTLTRRINKLADGIKDIGAFDAAMFPELGSPESAQDGKYIPVANLAERLGGRDFSNVIASVDMRNKVETMARLVEMRESEKNIIYELQGIADIVRGASVASETATAQAIKDKHFQVRLSEKINELRRYWRDSYRILAEMIGEHYTEESFFIASGVELGQDELHAAMNEIGRSYMIDIETEDTTFEDDEKERAQGIELIRTFGEILNMQQAVPPDLLVTLLKFGSNLFKQGRVLEDGIATLPSSMQQFEQLNQTIQQMQGENQALQEQMAQLQQALQESEGREQMREDFEAQSDAQAKGAKAAKDAAEAQQTQIENAQMVRFSGLPQ